MSKSFKKIIIQEKHYIFGHDVDLELVKKAVEDRGYKFVG